MQTNSFDMHASSFKNYRSAVALNNIGVSLLEKRCYQQAMATLKDAVTVLKIGFKSRSDTTELSEEDTSFDVKGMLSRATKRLARPKPSVAVGKAPIRLSVQSNSDMHAAANLAIEQGPTLTVVYAVRIDEIEFDTVLDRNPDTESSITLLNFAISYLFMSRVTGCAGMSRSLRCGALKIFVASHSILEACQTTCEDELHANYMVHVEALVMSSLVQLSREVQGGGDASIKLYSKFVRLRSLIFELSELSIPSLQVAAGAA
jgi:hypothetical protein